MMPLAQEPPSPDPPPTTGREIFWGYMDVLVFAGLTVPSLLLGDVIVKLTMALFHWHARFEAAEAVPAHVTVHTLGAHATITALDAGGHPLGRIPSKLAKGALTFDLPAGGRSLWYSIETDANFITPEEPVRPKRPHRHTPPPPAPPPRTGEGGLTGGRYASSEASSMPAFPPVVRGTPPIAGESSCREHALNASY